MCVFSAAKHKGSVMTEVRDACCSILRLSLARSAACRCVCSLKTATEAERESRGKQNVMVGRWEAYCCGPHLLSQSGDLRK